MATDTKIVLSPSPMASIISGVGGVAGGIGSAVGGAGRALASSVTALGNAASAALRKPDQTINETNVGIVAGAAQEKVSQPVSGAGSLPPRVPGRRPAVSERMSTEKLLNVAVNYLSSIDASLKRQVDYQIENAREQASRERENKVEKKDNIFTRLSDRIKMKAGRAVGSMADKGMDVLKTAGFVAAAAAAAKLSTLDTEQLNDLKKKIDSFQNKFGWLEELATFGALGARFGGIRGAILAMSGDIVWQGLRDIGLMPKDVGGTLGNAAAAGGIGYGLYRVGKAAFKLTPFSKNFVLNKFGNARAGLNLARTVGTTYRDSVTGARAGSTAKFFASARWRNFMAWLAKKGKRQLVKKIETRIAIAIGSAAVAATGAGAIFGAIGILVDIGLSVWLVVEIYQLWNQWHAEKKAENQGVSDEDISDAIKESGPGVSTDKSTAAANANAKPGVQGGGYQNKEIAEVLSSGAGFTTVKYKDGSTETRGGTIPARTNNPGDIIWGDFARKTGAIGFTVGTVGPDIAVYPTPEAGWAAMQKLLSGGKYGGMRLEDALYTWSGKDPTYASIMANTTGIDLNKSYNELSTDEQFRLKQAMAKQEGFFAKGSGPTMAAPSQSMASTSVESLSKGLKFAREYLLDVTAGKTTLMNTNTLNNAPAEALKAQQIQNEVDLTLGAKTAQAKQDAAARTLDPLNRLRQANGGQLDTLDPNYKVDPKSIVSKYFVHFGMTA